MLIDVILFSAEPAQRGGEQSWRFPPARFPVEVAPGIQWAGVRPEIATAVVRATRFRAPFPRDVPIMYGLVRSDPPGASWDEDDALSRVLFLSHFVHANEGGLEYSARLRTNDDGGLVDLYVGEIHPPFARAYCTSGAARRWLTQAEVNTLRDVVAAYARVKPSLADTKLGLAISTYAESPFVFHGRPRALLLVTTLEGLVNTMPDRSVKQFTTRAPALAAEVDLPQLDRRWAEATYRLRSTMAHGGSLLGPAADTTGRDEKLVAFNHTLTELDELLRRVLRRALLDDAFRERVMDPDKHWPVQGRGCPTCRGADPGLLRVECPRCRRKWLAGPAPASR